MATLLLGDSFVRRSFLNNNQGPIIMRGYSGLKMTVLVKTGMLGRILDEVRPMKLVVLAGSNDLSEGVTADELMSLVQQLCSEARARGVQEIIIFSAPPRSKPRGVNRDAYTREKNCFNRRLKKNQKEGIYSDRILRMNNGHLGKDCVHAAANKATHCYTRSLVLASK